LILLDLLKLLTLSLSLFPKHFETRKQRINKKRFFTKQKKTKINFCIFEAAAGLLS